MATIGSVFLIFITILLQSLDVSVQSTRNFETGCNVSTIVDRPTFEAASPSLGPSVTLQNLKCFNVSFSVLNLKYLDHNDAKFREIVLESISNNLGSSIKLHNGDLIEILQLSNCNVSDSQFNQLLISQGMPNLRILDMSKNRIAHLDQHSFQKSTRIRILNLKLNLIHRLPGKIFHDLVDLSELYLSNNLLVNFSIHDELFINLQQLSILDISNNSITDLPRNVFNGLAHLIQLDLAHNKLYVIPFQVFKELRIVEILDLSYNLLISFLDNFFISELKFLQQKYIILRKIFFSEP